MDTIDKILDVLEDEVWMKECSTLQKTQHSTWEIAHKKAKEFGIIKFFGEYRQGILSIDELQQRMIDLFVEEVWREMLPR